MRHNKDSKSDDRSKNHRRSSLPYVLLVFLTVLFTLCVAITLFGFARWNFATINTDNSTCPTTLQSDTESSHRAYKYIDCAVFLANEAVCVFVVIFSVFEAFHVINSRCSIRSTLIGVCVLSALCHIVVLKAFIYALIDHDNSCWLHLEWNMQLCVMLLMCGATGELIFMVIITVVVLLLPRGCCKRMNEANDNGQITTIDSNYMYRLVI
jgi:hypothetical protein